MRNRWGILAVLFVVRLSMSFQFQSVAAVAPLLGHDFGVGLADIGFLIGLYFTPGVALALPGGAIGQRFGDKTTVLGALRADGCSAASRWRLRIPGAEQNLRMAPAPAASAQCSDDKMVTDWFAARRSQRDGDLRSWPVGATRYHYDTA